MEGNQRLSSSQIIGTSGIIVHQPVNYRDIQRAITSLFRTGQFDDVLVEQRSVGGRLILVIKVKERPVLEKWAVRGVNRLSEGDVKGRVQLTEGRPLDRNAVEQARAGIDSLYKDKGYYASKVKVLQLPQESGKIRVVFDVEEGERVAISQVVVDSNKRFSDKAVVKHMSTRPEGFWWFQKGEYDERKVEEDVRERLPALVRRPGLRRLPGHPRLSGLGLRRREGGPAAHGRRGTGLPGRDLRHPGQPALLHRRADGASIPSGRSGPPARRPGSPGRSAVRSGTRPRRRCRTCTPTTATSTPRSSRRRSGAPGAVGNPLVDLRWNIREGSPATINKVEIVGNDVTHERVIREAIVMLPGDLFSRERLIRSYQNVSNLGFFQQPLPSPDVKPAANGVDVDIIFRVEERRTGNINFGASLGQGTGVGGFLGLEEPNLFGRGKRGKLQWQFGQNINDFTLSYTDPAIRESRISGTISLFDSRARYTVGDLGRRKQTGGSLQLGFPFLGSRYTRLFTSYSFQRIRYSEGSADLQARFRCSACSRSTLGASVLRDTRVGLPFATGGSLTNVSGELNGGFLGGTGNYRKVDLEGRWYAPLGTLGGGGQLGAGVQFVLGLTAKSGFIFGDAGPFFTELYSLGGVQYGVPLRGYEEFSITPNGFDPTAGGNNAASPDAFGESYSAFTIEAGARISQSLYVSSFFDAGNVYRSARQWDPTRLFRGAGFGAAVISPLGPIGVDLGYGFDRVDALGRPKPGWQLHFKLGNFF